MTDVQKLRRLNEYPLGFEDWHRTQQADYVRRQMTRVGLVERVLVLVGIDPDRQLTTGDARLTKTELAAIYLTLKASRTTQ